MTIRCKTEVIYITSTQQQQSVIISGFNIYIYMIDKFDNTLFHIQISMSSVKYLVTAIAYFSFYIVGKTIICYIIKWLLSSWKL